jgi:hypothetical protein
VASTISFETFVNETARDGMDAVRKRMNKKSPKKRHYGHAPGESGAGSGVSPSSASGGMTEKYDSLLGEILNGSSPFISQEVLNSAQMNKDEYEEDEEVEKKDQAAAIFRALYKRKDLSREDIIREIEKRTGVTNSTAVSYYQRLAKEAGIVYHKGDDEQKGNSMFGVGIPDEQQSQDEIPDEDKEDDANIEGEEKEGVIRTVDGAHLIKKDQRPDGKFEEMWMYNVDKDMRKVLQIRRAILAGTDIGEKKTKSDDGEQEYSLWTLGNAQILHIKGLPN